MFPGCTDAGAGRPGKDLLNTPGLTVEVKAKGEVSLVAMLRKAKRDGELGDMPAVIWRHNGQGEKTIDQWTLTLFVRDFEELWRKAHAYVS
jgi:hypothetical protein